jgi:hypothetical protein
MTAALHSKTTLREAGYEYCCRDLHSARWLEDTKGVNLSLLGSPICASEGIIGCIAFEKDIFASKNKSEAITLCAVSAVGLNEEKSQSNVQLPSMR